MTYVSAINMIAELSDRITVHYGINSPLSNIPSKKQSLYRYETEAKKGNLCGTSDSSNNLVFLWQVWLT